MSWQLDGDLHDPVALEEIELCSELMIAAAASDGPLSSAQIDDVLAAATADASAALSRHGGATGHVA